MKERHAQTIVQCAILVLAILGGCQESRAMVTIDELERPDWPATAAGVGPASVMVAVDEVTSVRICPLDPDDCTEYTIEPGSWVVHLNVPDDEIWHVSIK